MKRTIVTKYKTPYGAVWLKVDGKLYPYANINTDTQLQMFVRCVRDGMFKPTLQPEHYKGHCVAWYDVYTK